MRIISAFDRLTKFLMVAGALWAFGLCFLVLAEIGARAINQPISGTKELIANSVVMILFMQVGYAVRSGSMLRADFLVVLLPPVWRKALLIMAYVLGAAFFLFLFKSGLIPAMRSFEGGEFDGEGALKVPVWPARFAIVGGSLLASINYVLLCIIEIFDLRLEPSDL